jgi:hypothetical protein
VLSMQNNYQGPLRLRDGHAGAGRPAEENVKTLTAESSIASTSSMPPRLVEYWEQDPCYEPPPDGGAAEMPEGRRRRWPRPRQAPVAPTA